MGDRLEEMRVLLADEASWLAFLDSTFKALDLDQNNFLSMEEFGHSLIFLEENGLASFYLPDSIENLFIKYDIDQDGKISQIEFAAALKDFIERYISLHG